MRRQVVAAAALLLLPFCTQLNKLLLCSSDRQVLSNEQGREKLAAAVALVVVLFDLNLLFTRLDLLSSIAYGRS